MPSTEWNRMVLPQADGYDSRLLAEMAQRRFGPFAPALDHRAHLFDGAVPIAHVYRGFRQFELTIEEGEFFDGPLVHANYRVSDEYLKLWPEVYSQGRVLLHAVHPVLLADMPLRTKSGARYRGSCSNSYEQMPGTLWATMHCPIGFAQAIVHEMAHQKLRAMGVSRLSADSMLLNDTSAKYESPLRPGFLRPMSAILHATYSFAHVLELQRRIVVDERPATKRSALLHAMETNAGRLTRGMTILSRDAILDDVGKLFVLELGRWVDTLKAITASMTRTDGGR